MAPSRCRRSITILLTVAALGAGCSAGDSTAESSHRSTTTTPLPRLAAQVERIESTVTKLHVAIPELPESPSVAVARPELATVAAELDAQLVALKTIGNQDLGVVAVMRAVETLDMLAHDLAEGDGLEPDRLAASRARLAEAESQWRLAADKTRQRADETGITSTTR